MTRPTCTWLALCLLLVPAAGFGQESSPSRPLAEARGLIEQERPEAALEVLDPVLRQRTAPAEAFLLLAYCHLLLGEQTAAATALESALERDPDA
ncbi:MAG: tetratricopeptide repeat protein, partial [Thermoanaerobaculia bacterium]|nr:tetratricopeptide repeat protein [Thermoanaerobaculia bacterium]